MPPNFPGIMIPAIAFIVITMLLVGLPSLAVVAIKYFKMKERELALEMEFRQSSRQKDSALEQRVQRLEDALTSLDHDVRVHLGIGKSATSLQSRPELAEAPAAQESPRGPPAWTKTR